MDQVLERQSAPESTTEIEATLNYLVNDGVKIFTKLLLWNNYGGVWPTNGPAAVGGHANGTFETVPALSLIHISEPTRRS